MLYKPLKPLSLPFDLWLLVVEVLEILPANPSPFALFHLDFEHIVIL
jgi:hypothetical protein